MNLFDKLVLAVTNIIKDSQPAKKVLLKVNLFTPILVYLSRVIDKIGSEPLYSEERATASLNLLSQAVDAEPDSQNWILNNVKIDEICAKLLFQTESLQLAGMTCLLISQLCGGNPNA